MTRLIQIDGQILVELFKQKIFDPSASLSLFSQKNNFFAPGLRALPGAKTVPKHMRRMIRRTASQFVAKFYQKVPRESALTFTNKFGNFP